MVIKNDNNHTHIMIFLPNEQATLALGRALSQILEPGLVIFLEGELGAGKTTLVRSILRGLGFSGRVKSPTYALVESYLVPNLKATTPCRINSSAIVAQQPDLHLHHFDLYRLHDPKEWEDAALGDYLNAYTICLIEWPERAIQSLPNPDWHITLSLRTLEQTSERYCCLKAMTSIGKACLKSLQYP